MLDLARRVESFLIKHIQVPASVSAAQKVSVDRKLPAIAVPVPLGKFLDVLAGDSRRVLEIGTLGGVSCMWMAQNGRTVTTLEISKKNAEVAATNFRNYPNVKLLVGDAAQSLKMLPERSFDFMFIDADKARNELYVREGVERLIVKGGLIVVDNVIREGKLVDGTDAASTGTRAMFEYLSKSSSICDFSAIQTLDSKGHDGFCLIRLKRD